MRLFSVIVAFLASGALAAYVLTCSINDTPPVPVHPIVGKWRMVVMNGRPVVPGRGIVIEYRADGVVVFHTVEDEEVRIQERGHYVIEGNSMDVTVPSRTTRQCFNFAFTLVTLDRLSSTNAAGSGAEEYVRVAH